MWKTLLEWRPVAFVLDVMDTYNRVGVSRGAASLAYFLILTLFPLLMCANYFIGVLSLSPDEIFFALSPLLPQDSLGIIMDYLRYVSGNQSPALLVASLFTIVLSASAGLRTLLQTMDELYEVHHPGGLRRLVLSVFLSLFFLLTIYLSIVVIFTGGWFFRALESWLPDSIAQHLSLFSISSLWLWLRYLLLFCSVLMLVLAVYRAGIPPSPRRRGSIHIAATLTAAALAACSVVFSWFIDMSTRYSLVYGSLASLIILLVWLYFCGSILLLGAVVGKVWIEHRSRRH